MADLINPSIETAEDLHAHAIALLAAGRRFMTDEEVYNLYNQGDFKSNVDATPAERDPFFGRSARTFIDSHDASLVMTDEEKLDIHQDGKFTGAQIWRCIHLSGSEMLRLLRDGHARMVVETTEEPRGPRTKIVTRYYIQA